MRKQRNVSQIKEQENAPEKDLSTTETRDPPGAESKLCSGVSGRTPTATQVHGTKGRTREKEPDTENTATETETVPEGVTSKRDEAGAQTSNWGEKEAGNTPLQQRKEQRRGRKQVTSRPLGQCSGLRSPGCRLWAQAAEAESPQRGRTQLPVREQNLSPLRPLLSSRGRERVQRPPMRDRERQESQTERGCRQCTVWLLSPEEEEERADRTCRGPDLRRRRQTPHYPGTAPLSCQHRGRAPSTPLSRATQV